jgi:TM2 domain-containing membrane protein YozV
LHSQKLHALIPGISQREYELLLHLTQDLNDAQLETFAGIYRGKRQSPDTILLTALAGFLGIAGIHRFLMNQIGMGILYLLTSGLCFIGTIVDLVNYQRLTLEFNEGQALDAKSLTLSIHSV